MLLTSYAIEELARSTTKARLAEAEQERLAQLASRAEEPGGGLAILRPRWPGGSHRHD